MTKYYSFSEEAVAAFEAAASDKYDFTTCQRSDGSYYGTGGQCRKGTETTKPEKEAKRKKPVDSGSMGKMSDSQLKQLAGRKELDSDQKAAISKEMQDRKNASLNSGNLPGQDKRTQDAESETARVKNMTKEEREIEKNKTEAKEFLDKHQKVIEEAAEYSFLKAGGSSTMPDGPQRADGTVYRVSKAEAKAEMMDNYRYHLSRDTIEAAMSEGYITKKQFNSLKKEFNSDGDLKTIVQTAPVTRLTEADTNVNEGGWKMGVNGSEIRLTQLEGGTWLATME